MQMVTNTWGNFTATAPRAKDSLYLQMGSGTMESGRKVFRLVKAAKSFAMAKNSLDIGIGVRRTAMASFILKMEPVSTRENF